MADTDWNLHSKQLVTPTDNDRMLLEPSDETAKAVEVGGFREWLMGTALFSTLTTTAKNIIGAIEEVKGIADNNTTQLNEKVNKSSIINNCSVTEEGFALDARQGKWLRDILQVDKIKTYSKIITLRADTIQNIEIDFSELGMASTPFYATCIMASGNNGSLREIRYEFDASTKDKAIFKLISDTPMEAISTRFSFLIVHQ